MPRNKKTKTAKRKVRGKSKLILPTSQTILLILGEIATGTIESFFPHPYYHAFCNHENCNHKNYNTLYKSLSRLEKLGLIQKSKERNKNKYSLTKQGKRQNKSVKLLIHLADTFIGPKKYQWDGKWRIVMFDIPEYLKKYRDELRTQLEMLNFFQLQKSVWIHPLPLPKEFFDEFINPTMRRFVKIALVDYLDNEKDIRKYFFGD